MKHHLTTRQQQQGVALIIALIITTIALVLAASVIYRQQLHIRLTSNIASLEQAYQYASGMEDWAGTILQTDFEKDKKIDSLDEDWATLLPPIPIPGGSMNGQLFDLGARINLNSLARKPPPPVKNSTGNQPPGNNNRKNPKSNFPPGNKNQQAQANRVDVAKITRQRLKNMIAQIDPDQEMGPPENFADVVKDWIDADQINGNIAGSNSGNGSGAESPYYQSLEHPYFSADTLMVSPTELRLLKGIDEKHYTKLLPLISTLPIEEKNQPIKTPINVNTASADIFKAIGFTDTETENIISARENHKKPDKQAFKDINEFLDLDDVKGALSIKPPRINKGNLDVKSSFFLLEGIIKINQTRLFINSVLHRKNGKVSVIMRDFSNLQNTVQKTEKQP